MRVPGSGPLLCIFIYRVQEKMVEEPYMSVDGGVEAASKLQFNEEIGPFDTKSAGNIKPKALNSNIVNTATLVEM